ncbi:VOC family protein [uncultured Imperialibacter sp.]|uniref:VOC family protein n=1 Tax=uncultured Imperialibacter sp. TaxID=1672639 RepID=UPI0030DC66C9|tara:strand:- start:773 stop:1600 length:828 start_codon:yes stop_codon:yes gene_type:complete
MSLPFDHLVIKVDDLEKATQTFTASGFVVTKGGVHRGGFSENALVMFKDGSFLELLSIRKGIKPFLLKLYSKTQAFRSLKYSKKWGLFHRFYDRALSLPEGVTDFCLLSADIKADLTRVNDGGLFVTKPMAAARKKPDGTKITWQMASTLLTELPFIRGPYSTPSAPSEETTTHKNGIVGIKSITLLALDFKEMMRNLTTLLGQEPQQNAAEEDKEARYIIGSTTLILKKSSENDALIKKLRSKGLGVFGIEWEFGTSGSQVDFDFSNLHGLVML